MGPSGDSSWSNPDLGSESELAPSSLTQFAILSFALPENELRPEAAAAFFSFPSTRKSGS